MLNVGMNLFFTCRVLDLYAVLFVLFCFVVPVHAHSSEDSVHGFSDSEVEERLVMCLTLGEGRDVCYASLCEGEPGYICAEDVLDTAVVVSGPERAMAVLHDIMASPVFAIRTDGHLLAHVIGRASSRVLGSSGESFLRCSHDFNDGCYHGFFEDTLVKVNDPVKVAVGICESMPPGTTSLKEKDYCYHGAGHVFLMNESYNLDNAISHCVLVPDQWVDSCLSGVFMENAWPSREWEKKKKNFRDDDLLFPCNVLEDRFKPMCYIEHYSYLVNNYTTSLDELIRICSGAGSYARYCIGGLAVMFQNSQWVNTLSKEFTVVDEGHIEKVIFLCGRFPDEYKGLCVSHVVPGILNFDYPDMERVLVFCMGIEEQYRSQCFGRAGSYLSHLGSEEQKNLSCVVVPEVYRDNCFFDGQDDGVQLQDVSLSRIVADNPVESFYSQFLFSEVVKVFVLVFQHFVEVLTGTVFAHENVDDDARSFDNMVLNNGIDRCLMLSEERATCYNSLCDDVSKYLCAEDILNTITITEGPELGMQVLVEMVESPLFSFSVGDEGHNLAHVIGRATAKQFDGMGEAFLRCPTMFDYGCNHGFLEVVLVGDSSPAEVIRRVCESLPEKPEIGRPNCYHGSGHGVMMNESYNLNSALSVCDELLDEALGCWSGVFMENVSGYITGRIADQFPENNSFRYDDPYAPCSIVDEKYREVCYQVHVPYLGEFFKYDLQKVIETCLNAGRYTHTCVYGFGWHILFKSIQDRFFPGSGMNFIEKSIYLCNKFPKEYWEVCYRPAVNQISVSYGAARAFEFCEKVEEQYMSMCYREVGRRLNDLILHESEMVEVCAAVSERYRGECLSVNQERQGEWVDGNVLVVKERQKQSDFSSLFSQVIKYFFGVLEYVSETLVQVASAHSDDNLLESVDNFAHPNLREGVERCLYLREGMNACFASLCDGSPGYICTEDIIDVVTVLEGPEEGIRVLSEIVVSPEFRIPGDIHQLAHVVGRSAARNWGGTGDVFNRCPVDFDYGCVHGFFENALLHVVSPVDALIGICEVSVGSDHDKGNCYHGGGHGIMQNEGYDLNSALFVCDSLPDHQSICRTGVFMENAMGFVAGRIPEENNTFREDNLYAPCDAVEEKNRGVCYAYHHRIYLPSVISDFSVDSLVRLCLNGEEVDVEACFNGLFEAFITESHAVLVDYFPDLEGSRAVKTAFLCSRVPEEYVSMCHTEVVNTMVVTTDVKYLSSAVEFCNSVEMYQQECFVEINKKLDRVVGSGSVKQDLCEALSEEYQVVWEGELNECVFGGYEPDEHVHQVKESTSWFQRVILFFGSLFERFTFSVFAHSEEGDGSLQISDVEVHLGLREIVERCLSLEEDRDACYVSLCEDGSQYICVEDIIGIVSTIVDAEEAMKELYSIVWADKFFFDPSFGHNLGHIVGRETARKFGVNGSAFLMCPDDFDYACQHGFVEYALAETNSPIEVVKQMCETMPDIPNVAKGNCYHGSGHALMQNNSYDLWVSLDHCSKFEEKYLGFCETGVFMENVNGYLRGEVQDWFPDNNTFREDDPHAPCSDISDDEIKRLCYISHAPYLMSFYDYDLRDIVDACVLDGIGRNAVEGCVYSIGAYSRIPDSHRILLKDHNFQGDTVEAAIYICDQFPDEFRLSCYMGVLNQNIIDYGFDNVSSFCRKVDKVYKKECWRIVGRRLDDIVYVYTEKELNCSTVPGEYQDDCLGIDGTQVSKTHMKEKLHLFFVDIVHFFEFVFEDTLRIFVQSVFAHDGGDLPDNHVGIDGDSLEACFFLSDRRDKCYMNLCSNKSGYICAVNILDIAVPVVGADKAMMALHDIMSSSIFSITSDGHLLSHVIGRSLSKNFGLIWRDFFAMSF